MSEVSNDRDEWSANERSIAPFVSGLSDGPHLESLEDTLGVCACYFLPFGGLLWGVGDEVDRLF